MADCVIKNHHYYFSIRRMIKLSSILYISNSLHSVSSRASDLSMRRVVWATNCLNSDFVSSGFPSDMIVWSRSAGCALDSAFLERETEFFWEWMHSLRRERQRLQPIDPNIIPNLISVLQASPQFRILHFFPIPATAKLHFDSPTSLHGRFAVYDILKSLYKH